MPDYLNFDGFAVLLEQDTRYLFPEFAEEEDRLNPSDYIPSDQLDNGVNLGWAEMMERDYSTRSATILHATKITNGMLRKIGKGGKVMRMRPKSAKAREKFVMENLASFRQIIHGKRGKITLQEVE